MVFEPKRNAAERALENFLPHAGRDYATGRNYDPGPEASGHVSRLSPWLRTRLLNEWTVLARVLSMHRASAAQKFIDEVCWRTYWKGWLALRPTVWSDYLGERARLLRDFQGDSAYETALAGKTGIACFDAWVQELLDTGYLHNHARMWFASIWVHTLRLPWALGADFFFRHLLDGDAASNTLGWRWVAGLQTRDKAYLARPDNIRKFTGGRFHPPEHQLAAEPAPLEFEEHPPRRSLPDYAGAMPTGKVGLLLTEDDLSAGEWLAGKYPIQATAALLPVEAYRALGIDARVADFRAESMKDVGPDACFQAVAPLVDWCRAESLDALILAEPAVGLWDAPLAELKQSLADARVELVLDRHWWDACLYPHATHGFFRFKKAIPEALKQINL